MLRLFNFKHVSIIIFCLILLFSYFLIKTEPEPPSYLEEPITKEIPKTKEILKEYQDIIDIVNGKNDGIKNVSSDVRAIINNRALFKVHGYIVFEKEKNFRLILSSFIGKEADLGSNNQQFWFYIKRMDDPALYYCDYKDLYKTGLKTPFHPLWIMECFGFNHIVISENTTLRERGNYLEISEQRLSTSGRIVIKSTLVDKLENRIIGHYLWDDGRLIVSAEIKSFKNNVPSKIIFKWAEENITLNMELSNSETNALLSPNFWLMPNYDYRSNLASS